MGTGRVWRVMPAKKCPTNSKLMAPLASLQVVKRREEKKVCDMEKVDSMVYDKMFT